MTCNENNKSLLRLATNENNEILLLNKKGEIVSNINICNFIENCETTTTLSFNDLTGELSYKNEDNVQNIINLCELFNICNQSHNIPPFCITNLPTPTNPTVLPSPTVLDFGCEGTTTVQTYIRTYTNPNFSNYTDVSIATPIELSFLCNQQSTYKVEIVTVVTNSCGTYTDIVEIPLELDSGRVMRYFGVACCLAEITAIVTRQVVALNELNGVSFTNETIISYPIIGNIWKRDVSINNINVAISYNTLYENGYTAFNYGGSIHYGLSNQVFKTYINTDGIDVITTEGSVIGVYTSQTNSQNINTACDSHVLTVQSFDVIVPPSGLNIDGVVVDLASLIVTPLNITTPLQYNFIYNGITDNTSLHMDTGILNIPYSVPIWATAKAVFTVTTIHPTRHTPKVLAIAVLNAIEPI